MKRIFNEEQVQFIKENALTMTYREISELELFEGFTERQLRSKGRNLGIKKIREYDNSYFKNIDSEIKAYILGFIYADGYTVTSKTGSELGIELHEKDREILDRINQEFNNVHDIRYREREKEYLGYQYTSKTVVLRIHSNEIVNDLKKHSIIPNKTYHPKIFPEIHNTYFWEFLRGYFDGDGCIHIPKKSQKPVIHFTSSGQYFLEYLKIILSNDYGIKSTIYNEKENKYRLTISSYSIIDFLKNLYFNTSNNPKKFYLNRKFQLAKQFLGSL